VYYLVVNLTLPLLKTQVKKTDMTSKRQSRYFPAYLPAIIALALPNAATAQDATPTPVPAKTQNLGAVIVTGTRSDNRTESSSLTPIDVVSAKVLQQTGTNDLPTALAVGGVRC
jgi:iron complex outermembrane receptor protein